MANDFRVNYGKTETWLWVSLDAPRGMTRLAAYKLTKLVLTEAMHAAIRVAIRGVTNLTEFQHLMGEVLAGTPVFTQARRRDERFPERLDDGAPPESRAMFKALSQVKVRSPLIQVSPRLLYAVKGVGNQLYYLCVPHEGHNIPVTKRLTTCSPTSTDTVAEVLLEQWAHIVQHCRVRNKFLPSLYKVCGDALEAQERYAFFNNAVVSSSRGEVHEWFTPNDVKFVQCSRILTATWQSLAAEGSKL